MSSADPWHLDKKVPIAIILTLLIQCATIIWWGSAITKDSEDHSRRLAKIEEQKSSERLATVESQVSDARSSLARIEAKLDRLIEAKLDRLIETKRAP